MANYDDVIDLSQAVRGDAAPGKYLEFEFIEGLRAGTQLLYSRSERMIYYKQHVQKNYTRYACKNKGCKSKINLQANQLCVKPAKFVDHNHTNMADEYEKLMIRQDFKNLATNPNNPSSSSIQMAYSSLTEK